MAPGRRRGGKGVKTKSDLSLGDLVLAKVKGFPAWPAKISNSEDWDRAPDPKKYFVQFFGTSEIAFVAPADIQAFTTESKNKLSARCQGKTVNYFAQAVKEICEEFEALQHQNLSNIRDENNAKNLASEADSVVNEAIQVCRDHGTGDTKPCLSNDTDKIVSDNLVKELVRGTSPSNHPGEAHNDKDKDGYFDGQRELMSGRKPKQVMGPRRKPESAVSRNSSSAISHERTADEMPKEISSGSKIKVASNSKLSLHDNNGRKRKKMLKLSMGSEAAENDQMDSEVYFEGLKEVTSKKNTKFHQDHRKQIYNKDEPPSFSAVKSKSSTSNKVDDSGTVSTLDAGKNDSKSPVDLDVKMNDIEPNRLASAGQAETRRSFKVQTNAAEYNHSTDEDDLPPLKRHRRAPVVSTPALISESKPAGSASNKTSLVSAKKIRSPVIQQPNKRRAVRLCDDDEDELPKTPVHAGFNVAVSHMPDLKKKNVVHGESYASDKPSFRKSGRGDDVLKEQFKCSPVLGFSATAQRGMEKSNDESSTQHVSPGPPVSDTNGLRFMDSKPIIMSSKKSPESTDATKLSMEPQKQHFNKDHGSNSQKKISSVAERVLNASSCGFNTSLDQSISGRSKQRPVEKKKATSKVDSEANGSNLVVGNPDESGTLGDRLNVGRDIQSGFPGNLKTTGSTSMKHLIAAAQARKKQASTQHSRGNFIPLLVTNVHMPGQNPSPAPAPPVDESSSIPQQDAQGVLTTSPSFGVPQISSINERDNGEPEERRPSSGNQASGSSLSGGTEAAVARDAFEGMIETLSRTKDSIGRATRLAIDCAKYGIANEVVELLVHKLENEPSLHRKVDLFFLVDSITQCSHSQKGIAGASYVPAVQASLARLIGAAAPHEPSALENRRQCHKVLRLWIERKILPESVLRRYVDGIGVRNDDSSAGLSLRRPSRTERAIDDPIREMEGMLVDEYGSNATFQLPGFLASRVFEEEEDEDSFPTNMCNNVSETLLFELTPSRDPESYSATPSDRRHCILEDVDGELEMEDVSGNHKDEKPLLADGYDVAPLETYSAGTVETASKMSELLPSAEGSPPLPLGSPPATPPLPTSPPPSSPPPPPDLPPPPPPPPPHSASPPPPPPSSSPPPPPPPLPSSQHVFLPPPSGLPPFISKHSLPPQPALMPQCTPPLPSTVSSSSQPLAYLPPSLPQEIVATSAGSQDIRVVPNFRGSHVDATIRGEVLPQQSSFFHPAATRNGREHSVYKSSRLVEYGQGDTFMTPQATQHTQQFLAGGASFTQRHLHLEPPPQQTPSNFSYPSSAQQHQYLPYQLPSFSEDPRRYTGVNTGYFGPPPERPQPNAPAFLPSAGNSVPTATPTSVHGVPMIPCKPDAPGMKWRPA